MSQTPEEAKAEIEANPDDPRKGTCNKVTFHHHEDETVTVTLEFPEGEPVVKDGLSEADILEFSLGLVERGYSPTITENGDLVFEPFDFDAETTTLSPEAQAFLSDPDDPRRGKANKVTLVSEQDNTATVTFTFPEHLGEPVSQIGVSPQDAANLAQSLVSGDWSAEISEDGYTLTLVAPAEDVQAA